MRKPGKVECWNAANPDTNGFDRRPAWAVGWTSGGTQGIDFGGGGNPFGPSSPQFLPNIDTGLSGPGPQVNPSGALVNVPDSGGYNTPGIAFYGDGLTIPAGSISVDATPGVTQDTTSGTLPSGSNGSAPASSSTAAATTTSGTSVGDLISGSLPYLLVGVVLVFVLKLAKLAK